MRASAAFLAGRRARPAIPLAERFWQKVDKSGPVMRPELGRCWAWRAAESDSGYGLLGRGVRGAGIVRATHVSWEIHRGPVPAGVFLLHRCDNPPCTNPDHLFLGDAAANMNDCKSKRRHAHGETSYSKLTESDVLDIRTLYAFGARNGDLSRAFGVSPGMIGLIVGRKRWTHVP